MTAMFASLILAGHLGAAASEHPVRASLVAETKGFQAGQALTVALRLVQKPGWHTYWKDPGEAGLPTEVQWSLPTGVKAGPLLWPQPEVFKDPSGLTGYGYSDEAFLLTEISVPASYSAAELPLQAQATWLVCREICIPGDAGMTLVLARLDPNPLSANAPDFARARRSLGRAPAGYTPSQPTPSLEAGSPAPVPPPRPTASLTRVAAGDLGDFEGGRSTPEPAPAGGGGPSAPFPLMLLLAFVGGLILNLMPCVLPVLSLKALSFVEHSKASASQGLRLGLAFGMGVLVSFWALAALVVALKGAGQAVGWGFQFQSPAFVLFMAAVVLAFSLNLFGLFEILLPGSATAALAQGSQARGLLGSFSHGVFMTLLATPCTAPFLGTALGFAFAADSPTLFAVFTSAALGLAAPFVALAAWPASRAWLPKPGAWMLRFKELMGFLLLATLVWLLFVLDKQVGADRLARAGLWLWSLALALWAWGRFGGLERPARARWTLFLGLAAGLALAGAGLLPEALKPAERAAPAQDGWIPYDAAEIERLRGQGRTVFVDFTADWCWTCKVNEKAVLGTAAVQEAFAKGSVVLVRGDWTRRDAAISAALASFGRSGVPLYVVYHGRAEPKVLPEVITPSLVLNALKP